MSSQPFRWQKKNVIKIKEEIKYEIKAINILDIHQKKRTSTKFNK
jgi:hypothetical protein